METQYALERIEAFSAWEFSTGSTQVVVAVIDSGIDLDHPDLVESLWTNLGDSSIDGQDNDGNGFVDDINGWDFGSNDNTSEGMTNHGTHVSGIIGANGDNGVGVAGVNWSIGLVPLRVGSSVFPTSNIIAALEYVKFLKEERGIPIVATNNSYGSSSLSSALQNAVEAQEEAGILFVAAAGNDGRDNDLTPHYPAGFVFDHIISVAATTGGDNLADFSNFGGSTVDMAAPGSQVHSTILGAQYGYINGTSMAAPQATGAVALLKAADSTLEWDDLKQLILSNVDQLTGLSGKTVTGGRLNLLRAMEAAVGQALPVLRIVSPLSRVVRTVGVSSNLLVEIEITVDGQVIEDPSGTLQWEVFPTSAGVLIEERGPTGAILNFPAVDDYSGQVTYFEDGFSQSDEIYVRVGDGDILTDGLSAFWKFDDGGGLSAADSSGSGRHGTVEGSTWNNGIIGGALDFDGVNDKVSFPSPSLASFSLSAWVSADSKGNSVFPRIIHTDEFILYWGRRDGDPDPLEPDNRTVKFASERDDEEGIWNTANNVVDDGP